VIEIADVFRRFAGEYLSAHGEAMPPSHRRAIAGLSVTLHKALEGANVVSSPLDSQQ
jgi:hypothetical protein